MPKANKIVYIEYEDYIEGIFENGISFYFDKEDYEFVKTSTWHINNSGYIQSNKYKLMHRYFLKDKLTGKLQTDHINQNKLDNRRLNLRVVTQLENLQNKTIYKNNYSGYSGIAWHKIRKKWQVSINNNGTKKYIGIFNTLQDAIVARRKAEKGTL